MMRHLYSESLADIPVSLKLIRKTQQLMKQRRGTAQGHKNVIRYSAIAVGLAMFIICVIIFPKFIKRPDSTGNPSNAAALAGQQQAGDNENPIININQLGNMMNIPPRLAGPCINRTEEWTFSQYCGLLGFNPLPAAVPRGLVLVNKNTGNISFKDERRVDFYNTWSFVYTIPHSKNSKCIVINVNPSFIPYWSVPRAYQLEGNVQLSDVGKLLNLGEKSQINGTEITIWHKDKGRVWDYMGGDIFGQTIDVTDYYCADFDYKGAGFTVNAQNGVTEQEFVRVIESIIR